MRVLLLVAAMTATASADPNRFASWDELGVLRERVAMEDGYSVVGEAIRFAPHVPIGHSFYIGAELDTGSLSGRVPTSPTYRTTGGEMQPAAAASGKFGAVRALVGVRVRFGIVSVAGEFAAGVHAADLQDAYGQEISATRMDSTELSARARADLWLSPRFTVGVLAGAGLDNSSDATAGVMVGYHFGNYDGMQ